MTPKERSARKAGRDLPNEGDGGLAVVGDGIREVVQGVVERVQVHAVVLREVQRLRERLQDRPLGIGGGDQQGAPAGVAISAVSSSMVQVSAE